MQNCHRQGGQSRRSKKSPRAGQLGPDTIANFVDHIVTDPQGSYTGVPADPNERPVQDADDL